MALTYDDITAITQKTYIPVMVDNIFNSNAALHRAKKKWYKSQNGGTSIVQPLLYAQNSSAERQTSSSISTTSNSKKTAAQYEWRRYHAPVVIDGLDTIKNSGDSMVLSNVKTEIQIAEKSLADLLGTDLFADGSTAGSIKGFKLGTATTGTLGGISKASYSWWQGQQDTTTSTISLASMQSLFGDCTIDSDRPSVIFTTQDIYDDIYALIQPQQRFGDSETIKAGFTSIMWNGIPVIVDSHVDSGYLYMINEDYVSLTYSKGRDFKLSPFQQPVNQDASVAGVWWAGAMTYSNCRMLGAMTNIS